MPQSRCQRKRRPLPTFPTTPPGRKSSCMKFCLVCFKMYLRGDVWNSRRFANHQHQWRCVMSSPLTVSLSVSHLQGHDDDRLWLVSYHQTLGGTKQGGWPSQPSLELIREYIAKLARSKNQLIEFYTFYPACPEPLIRLFGLKCVWLQLNNSRFITSQKIYRAANVFFFKRTGKFKPMTAKTN